MLAFLRDGVGGRRDYQEASRGARVEYSELRCGLYVHRSGKSIPGCVVCDAGAWELRGDRAEISGSTPGKKAETTHAGVGRNFNVCVVAAKEKVFGTGDPGGAPVSQGG